MCVCVPLLLANAMLGAMSESGGGGGGVKVDEGSGGTHVVQSHVVQSKVRHGID